MRIRELIERDHPSTLWSAIDHLLDPVATMTEWRQVMASDFRRARSFLRPTSERAEIFPCPFSYSGDCPRRVVELDDGTILANCNNVERYCDTIHLKPSQLILHEMDLRPLMELAAQALGVQMIGTSVQELSRTFLVGRARRALKRIPVYWTLERHSRSLIHAASSLSMMDKGPFLLLLTSEKTVTDVGEYALSALEVPLIAMEELVGWDSSREEWMATEGHESVLQQIAHPDGDPTRGEHSATGFPAPPDSRWENLTIEFIANEVMSVRCKGMPQPRRVEPEHLGMKDQRSGKPNAQWGLLRAIAMAGGELRLERHHADAKLKKQKQLLSKALKKYFQMEEEPIPWDRESGAWHVRFRLVPYEHRDDQYEEDDQSLSLFEQARDPEWDVMTDSRLL
ncbi:MAG: hypothetical protein HQL50_11155 [Magnetococcales bacterium]|nr:hypothetical protein [Magnetococcales bacterium]